MHKYRLQEMIGGWFVGDFQPTVERTDQMEVAVKYYRSGDSEASHHHRIARELTVIAQGRVRMSGQEYLAGDIVVIEPGESTDFVAVEDTITVVVKRPSVRGDKYVD
ncbi:MAG: hypothetical protein U0795_04355 [Pirellulales bacterium]